MSPIDPFVYEKSAEANGAQQDWNLPLFGPSGPDVGVIVGVGVGVFDGSGLPQHSVQLS